MTRKTVTLLAACTATAIAAAVAVQAHAATRTAQTPHDRAVSIVAYRPDLGADYLNVADELLRRLGMDDARGRLAAMVNGASGAAA